MASGTGATGGDWLFEDVEVHHNTQDGLDLLHANADARITSGTCTPRQRRQPDQGRAVRCASRTRCSTATAPRWRGRATCTARTCAAAYGNTVSVNPRAARACGRRRQRHSRRRRLPDRSRLQRRALPRHRVAIRDNRLSGALRTDAGPAQTALLGVGRTGIEGRRGRVHRQPAVRRAHPGLSRRRFALRGQPRRRRAGE